MHFQNFKSNWSDVINRRIISIYLHLMLNGISLYNHTCNYSPNLQQILNYIHYKTCLSSSIHFRNLSFQNLTSKNDALSNFSREWLLFTNSRNLIRINSWFLIFLEYKSKRMEVHSTTTINKRYVSKQDTHTITTFSIFIYLLLYNFTNDWNYKGKICVVRGLQNINTIRREIRHCSLK